MASEILSSGSGSQDEVPGGGVLHGQGRKAFGGSRQASTQQASVMAQWDAESENAVHAVLHSMPSEPQEGNIEYKFHLVNPTEERLCHLITQLKWRLQEGQGEAIYEIGVEDDGTCSGLSEQDLEASLETLRGMAEELKAHVTMLRNIQGKKGRIAEVLVRQVPEDGDFVDVRVAVVGNVDSGKSTIVGVLTTGRLDNGRGLARSTVFRHRHELESGRTSSISQQIMGLDLDGNLVNEGCVREMTWSEIVERSSKVFTFIDLAGHERYIKTTVYGMTGCVPDYAMIVVGANMGVLRMTREHLGLALALKYPLIFVVTKVDMCPENILKQTVEDISKIMRSPGIRKMPYIIKNESDVVSCAKSLANDTRVAPIFLTSSVTGKDLPLLRLLLNLLPPRKAFDTDPAAGGCLHIDDTFQVAGVGTVVAGTLLRGSMTLKSHVMLGPDSNGHFQAVHVKSIMNKRLPVSRVAAGQTATFALKKVKKNQIRKGMVLAEASMNPRACLRFTAEVVVLNHHTTIAENYQPVVHCLTVRQASKITSISTEGNVLRTGDRARVAFEFLYRPEFMVLGARMIFREGRTKGIGKIVTIEYMDGVQEHLKESEKGVKNQATPPTRYEHKDPQLAAAQQLPMPPSIHA